MGLRIEGLRGHDSGSAVGGLGILFRDEEFEFLSLFKALTAK
jgi:hypothetical protein